ncbi:ABC transporter substrate-binding protein [Paenibacillus allorhizosphaerae]|uniref:Extracellular solute-binding protein n=1 Tax=Paenibacillus allorhizosphaerae TaxID=2849866 RepID=A0ABM8VJL9_9BACL|nr:extracellular solute-binding protein [Paenibacillus allorhizosphaerae]CAG7645686.1 hypothetical protein PAECIP111802_03579 [Paenibacillus allorhizosphaerae]
MLRSPKKSIALIVMLAVMLAACGKQNAATNQTQDAPNAAAPKALSTEPATIVLYNQQLYSKEEMERIFIEPVKKKFPHITLDIIYPGKGTQLADLIAAGTIPDMFFFKPYIEELIEADIPLTLDDLIKQSQYDLNKIDKVYLDAIRSYSPEGKLLGVPVTSQFYALWYNKDIFDKFGVPYPKDGMTWEDTIELAKQVTRNVDGVQYRGIDPNSYFNFSSALSLPLIDPKTEKPIISDKWKYVFETMMKVYNIPGNKPAKLVDNQLNSVFTKDMTLAMIPSFNILSSFKDATAKGLNWDVVQAPSHKDAPNKYYQVDSHILVVSKTSKYKEQAMQVIMAATAEDTQIALSRAGRMAAINSPEVKKQFAADLPYTQGKNMQGIFKSQPSAFTLQHKYNGLVRAPIKNAFQDVFDGKTDINTALRTAEEKANAAVQQAKETGK